MRALLPLLLLALPAAAGPWTAGRLGDERARLLRARGGSAATEKAVEAALDWLAAHQDGNGSWDADGFMKVRNCRCDGKGGGWHGERVRCIFDPEVTALATLAFLGAGHGPERGKRGKVVREALDWLEKSAGRTTLWGVAYTTQAMAEAYDLTGDERWKAAAARGVRTMVSSQQPQGGWRYYAGSRMASGVPTTTAVVVALETARGCGLAVPEDYRTTMFPWLDGLVDGKTNRVAYTTDAHTQGMTPTTTNAASALLMRLMCGVSARDPEVQAALGVLAKRRPKWKIRFKKMRVQGKMREVQIGYLQHYYWQHGTDALARVGGGSWSAWNGALKKALLKKQHTKGHRKGSWDPAGTYGKVGGRVFSTALCALMLETYYRVPG